MGAGMKRFIVWTAAVAWSGVAHALDANGNQQSDIWEMIYGASGLSAAGDQDNDRVSNSNESLAGTNPLDPASRPRLGLGFTNGVARIEWPSVAGKHYTIQLGGTRMRARHRLNPAQAIQRCNVNDPN